MLNLLSVVLANSCMLYMTHIHGSEFYNNRIKNKKIEPKIFDLGIKYTPDFSKRVRLSQITDIFTVILPFLFGKDILLEFIKMFALVIVVRWFFMSFTILPKNKSCNDTQTNLIDHLIRGNCYYKIFSGHFSVVFLMTLLLHDKKIISTSFLITVNILWALLIISLRYHYTVDIFTSVVVCLLIFQNRHLVSF